MGRAVYSSLYTTPVAAVAVRTEPEPVVDAAVERWSSYNHFDPDSDDFFQDAEFEAFITPDELRAQQGEATPLISDIRSNLGDSSDQESETTEGSDSLSGRSSPSVLNIQEAPSDESARTTSAAAILLEAALSTNTPEEVVDQPSPNDVYEPAHDFVERSPSPALSIPSTPPPQQTFPIFRRQVTPTRLFTPSPPASVTPRFYSWPAPATPVSPSFLPVTRNGHMHASMSYPRMDYTPVRVRITNPVM